MLTIKGGRRYSSKGEREREVGGHRHLFDESSDTVVIVASAEDSLGTSGFSRSRGKEGDEEARYSHGHVRMVLLARWGNDIVEQDNYVVAEDDGFACKMGKML